MRSRFQSTGRQLSQAQPRHQGQGRSVKQEVLYKMCINTAPRTLGLRAAHVFARLTCVQSGFGEGQIQGDLC